MIPIAITTDGGVYFVIGIIKIEELPNLADVLGY
jgi:hypothetical protein